MTAPRWTATTTRTQDAAATQKRQPGNYLYDRTLSTSKRRLYRLRVPLDHSISLDAERVEGAVHSAGEADGIRQPNTILSEFQPSVVCPKVLK